MHSNCQYETMKVLISNHNYTDKSQLLYFLHTEGQDLSKKKKKRLRELIIPFLHIFTYCRLLI